MYVYQIWIEASSSFDTNLQMVASCSVPCQRLPVCVGYTSVFIMQLWYLDDGRVRVLLVLLQLASKVNACLHLQWKWRLILLTFTFNSLISCYEYQIWRKFKFWCASLDVICQQFASCSGASCHRPPHVWATVWCSLILTCRQPGGYYTPRDRVQA